MEVSGQLHSPASLPPRETAPGTQCIGWAPELVWLWWQREKSMSLQGIESQSSSP